MASATVIQFPTGRGSGPEPLEAGDLYFSKATELVQSSFGKAGTAVRIDAVGNVSLIDSESDFYAEAITAPGFACLCAESSDPVRIAARLRKAHLEMLAWREELSEA